MSAPTNPGPMPSRPDSRAVRLRWGMVLLGCAAIGWGLWQLLVVSPSATRPLAAVAWLAGVLVVHDAVLAPLAVLVGAGLVAVLRPPARRWVGAALLVAVSLLLVAAPGVLQP